MDNPLGLDLIEWLLNYELDPPARRDVADEIKRLRVAVQELAILVDRRDAALVAIRDIASSEVGE
jgi:hypothetical protein